MFFFCKTNPICPSFYRCLCFEACLGPGTNRALRAMQWGQKPPASSSSTKTAVNPVSSKACKGKIREMRIFISLASHKVAGVREAIEAVGAKLLYLPPYSRDLNPISRGRGGWLHLRLHRSAQSIAVSKEVGAKPGAFLCGVGQRCRDSRRCVAGRDLPDLINS